VCVYKCAYVCLSDRESEKEVLCERVFVGIAARDRDREVVCVCVCVCVPGGVCPCF
jgi:hypothetical protein